eukprot:12002876-Alexandrium_andersonii.AAC.1
MQSGRVASVMDDERLAQPELGHLHLLGQGPYRLVHCLTGESAELPGRRWVIQRVAGSPNACLRQ